MTQVSHEALVRGKVVMTWPRNGAPYVLVSVGKQRLERGGVVLGKNWEGREGHEVMFYETTELFFLLGPQTHRRGAKAGRFALAVLWLGQVFVVMGQGLASKEYTTNSPLKKLFLPI